MYSTLLLEISGNVATITLNRPEKRNAISTQMMGGLQTLWMRLQKSRAVGILTGRASILRRHGFGHVARSPKISGAKIRRLSADCQTVPPDLDYPRPLIAAVNGAAYAGAATATLCDLPLAVPEAKFGYTE